LHRPDGDRGRVQHGRRPDDALGRRDGRGDHPAGGGGPARDGEPARPRAETGRLRGQRRRAGGGVGPALCGDIVIATGSARFEFAYPRIGLSADGGSSYFLPRLVGLRQAQRIAFRDEPVDADEAVELGLATETVDDDGFEARLAEEAARLAEGPTLAHAATKRLLRGSFDRSLDAQLATEAETIAGLTATEDFARGLESFLGEGDAEFEGE
jgi:2-(1,2-epoxy-1,2-dihydrophenyl)acetyl-CoA isomerase